MLFLVVGLVEAIADGQLTDSANAVCSRVCQQQIVVPEHVRLSCKHFLMLLRFAGKT
jgi:hypothetical protein